MIADAKSTMNDRVFVDLVADPEARIEVQLSRDLQAAAQTILAWNTNAANQVWNRRDRTSDGRRAGRVEEAQFIVYCDLAGFIVVAQPKRYCQLRRHLPRVL